MPKKTKIPKDAITESGMINFYKVMPKDLLIEPKNPNYHLHRFKLPFRACVVAPSGSGKTNWLINFVHLCCQGCDGTFADITIITRNKDEPLYSFLTTKSDQIQIKEGLSNLPPLDKFDKKEQHLVVLDDLVLSKDLSPVENYYIRARKLSVSVIFISQSYFAIPKIIRNNCSYLILLKLSGDREVNMILKESGLGLDKEQLLKMYMEATKNKFSPLIIDKEEEPHSRFRRSFLDILDPNDYVC
jgi:hypothetical protein